ncbi:type II toxin-antitoxin system HicA family toxin [Candidatus Gottesmanbacteria bacterium]|nr:type II toxin-antitoxin system HicA family toxin [Candidatus Gottesmanbacteria bacterium]
MSRLPSLKAREVLSILFEHGFEKVRTSGSHIRLRKGVRSVTVPFHPSRTVPKGTLNSILYPRFRTIC